MSFFSHFTQLGKSIVALNVTLNVALSVTLNVAVNVTEQHNEDVFD